MRQRPALPCCSAPPAPANPPCMLRHRRPAARRPRPHRKSSWTARRSTPSAPTNSAASATVFQDGRLFPHLTVKDNLLYGLKRRAGKPAISFVDETLDAARHRTAPETHAPPRCPAASASAYRHRPRPAQPAAPAAAWTSRWPAWTMPPPRRIPALSAAPARQTEAAGAVCYALVQTKWSAWPIMSCCCDQGQRPGRAGPISDIASRVDLPLATRDDAAGVLTGYHAQDHDSRPPAQRGRLRRPALLWCRCRTLPTSAHAGAPARAGPRSGAGVGRTARNQRVSNVMPAMRGLRRRPAIEAGARGAHRNRRRRRRAAVPRITMDAADRLRLQVRHAACWR